MVLDGPASSGGAGGAGGFGDETTSIVSNGTGTGAGQPSCDAYCAAVMANCIDDNALQYIGIDECLGTCKTFPMGHGGDTMGNSLACRAYHAAAAKKDPATHCSYAGVTGGDMDPGNSSPGVCGEGCEAFCAVALSVCAGTNEGFKDMADCRAQCKTFTPALWPYGSVFAHNGGSYYCRIPSLVKATLSLGDAQQICPTLPVGGGVCD